MKTLPSKHGLVLKAIKNDRSLEAIEEVQIKANSPGGIGADVKKTPRKES